VDGTCSECDPLSHLCNNDDELRTKRDEVTESWRRLHNEELHNLYFSLNSIRMKLRRMRWVGHVALYGR
jgi:hypothetical protein